MKLVEEDESRPAPKVIPSIVLVLADGPKRTVSELTTISDGSTITLSVVEDLVKVSVVNWLAPTTRVVPSTTTVLE